MTTKGEELGQVPPIIPKGVHVVGGSALADEGVARFVTMLFMDERGAALGDRIALTAQGARWLADQLKAEADKIDGGG